MRTPPRLERLNPKPSQVLLTGSGLLSTSRREIEGIRFRFVAPLIRCSLGVPRSKQWPQITWPKEGFRCFRLSRNVHFARSQTHALVQVSSEHRRKERSGLFRVKAVNPACGLKANVRMEV